MLVRLRSVGGVAFMKQSFLAVSLVALAIVFVSCSGRSSVPPALMPNVSGAWEFIAASSTKATIDSADNVNGSVIGKVVPKLSGRYTGQKHGSLLKYQAPVSLAEGDERPTAVSFGACYGQITQLLTLC